MNSTIFSRISCAYGLAATILISIGVSGDALAVSMDDFAIVAGQRVTVGGGSTINGNVAAGGNPGSGSTVGLAGGASVVGDVESNGRVQLRHGSEITGQVTVPVGETVAYPSSASVGSVVEGTPSIPTLPSPTIFASGGTSYGGLGNGASLSLDAGSYGSVAMAGQTTLSLSAGVYYFDSLAGGNGHVWNITLEDDESIEIYVTERATFGSLKVIAADGGDLRADQVYVEIAGDDGLDKTFDFKAGGGSHLVGTFYTTSAGIHLGGGSCCSSFEGGLWAATYVDIEHGVTGNGPSMSVPEPSAAILYGLGAILIRPVVARRKH